MYAKQTLQQITDFVLLRKPSSNKNQRQTNTLTQIVIKSFYLRSKYGRAFISLNS